MLERAEVQAAKLRTAEETSAADEVRADFPDHRLAVRWLFEHATVEQTARIVTALFEFCLFQLVAEGYEWVGQLAPLVDDASPWAPQVLGAAALAAWFKGSPDDAIKLGQKALDSIGGLDDVNYFWALQALFNAFSYTGRTQEGVGPFLRFVADSLRSGDPFWQVSGMGFDAIGFLVVGRPNEAIRRAEQAVVRARGFGNADCTHWALYCLGRTLADSDPASACQAFEDALAAARRVGSRWNVSLNLLEWIPLKRQLGDLRSAATGMMELLDLLAGSGNRSQLAGAFFEAAHLIMQLGEVELAFLIMTATRGMLLMDRGPQAAAADEDFAATLERAVGAARSRLSVRARSVSEQDLIVLCRAPLEDAARGRAPLPSHDHRRLRDITIVYTDLVSSTELGVSVGDDVFLGLMVEHNAIVRHRLQVFGGTEFTHTGDGVGAVFQETGEAVRFAVGLQSDFDDANTRHPSSQLRVRIGIVRGEALENEGNLFGQDVVRAVRVCAAAGAAQVLVTEEVATTAEGPAAHFRPFGAVPLKGFGVNVLLYEAVRD
jgi:class 3 adenylate cyclase